MRVLIADDDEIHRRLLSTALATEGHETVEAVDGVDALEKLSSGGFDAVFSDVLMPRMDGYRLGYEVRRSTQLQNTRIIIYSRTYTSLADERMALRAGADRFIRNPLGTETILRALRDATHARRQRKAAVPPVTELATVREYSEVLVGRLESANLKLEASRKRLARANEEIRKSEEQVRLLLDSTAEGIYGLDLDGNFTFCNAAGLAMLGYASARELLGRNAHTLIRHTRADGESYPMDESGVFRAIRENRGSHAEDEILWRADGTSFSTESWSYPVRKDGTLVGAVVTFLDITERRQVERRIQERTTFLNALVEHSPLGILVLDSDHRVQIANPAFVSLFGYSPEELQGRNLDDLIALGDDALRAEAAAFTRDGLAGHPVHAVTACRRKDGALVEVEIYGVPLLENGRLIGVYAIYQDLTERRRLEEQLLQAQKMEAIGQLAGGVAHDFNNLLTVILGYSDLLAAKLDPGSLQFEDLDEIRKAGERAASLTRQLLAFSRQQVLERKVLDVNDLIAQTEEMLRRLIGEDVELVTVLDPALRRVLADAGQLEQVIMNLAVNARDAMPRGGRLTIETANVELDEAYARLHATVRPGSYVMIAVSDTGVGMNGETLAHMFEPFFTTKGRGKGTGLGPATVYGIVKQSGGYVWVYSEVGKGTTFKIYLPRVEEGAETEPVPAAEPAALHGSETVLLVEDEQSVRTLSRSILEGYGYTVLEAESGKDGLDVARHYPRPIHLVLTDVVMPEMGGSDMASRLEALRPGVRVLYMSGYADDAVFRHGLLEKGRVFLQKPFTPETLARKVREALGS